MQVSERFLPRNVKPVHYEVVIEPDIENRGYKGNVVIDLLVVTKLTSIVSNVHKEVNIESTRLLNEGKDVAGVKLSRDESSERYTVSFDGELQAGSQIQLHHTFTGYLNSEIIGFYRTTYKDENGKDTYVASTQGQPCGARRIFPCFDEPHFKASFRLTLIIESNQECLNNMPVESVKQSGSKKHVAFEKTPLMSPYLVCFIVGTGFHTVKDESHKFPITIYAGNTEDAKNAEFSLKLASKTMDFFEQQFQAKYPLPKLDFAVFPNFFPGAMGRENIHWFQSTDNTPQRIGVSSRTNESVYSLMKIKTALTGNAWLQRWRSTR